MKIAIIEDNPGDISLINEFLGESGKYTSVVAKTFLEAENLLKIDKSIEAILLDLTLPDMQGDELVQSVIHLAGEIPVIVLTGFSDKEFGIKTLSLGVSDYLLKHELNAQALNKTISFSLERKRLQELKHEADRQYSNLFELSPQPIWIIDKQSNQFIDVNGAAEELYGYSKSDFLKMQRNQVVEVNHIILENSPLMQNKSAQTIEVHKKKNGELIFVDLRRNTIQFKNKEASLEIAIDVTERFEYISEIEHQNKILQDIAWTQSHVVRAPLSRLMGVIELIKLLNTENDNTDSNALLDTVVNSAIELDSILRDIASKTAEINHK
jgi:PAS domain S-box-containing protein